MTDAKPPMPPMPITLGKQGHFSGSSEYWRPWRAVLNEPDPWKAKLGPKVRSVVLPVANQERNSPISAPKHSETSVVQLVPLETPFIDDLRYKLAGATELATRLDLFLVDPMGPWVRRHGVLIAVSLV